MEQIWKDMLTEHDKKCLANQSSFQPRRGLGSKPALIVIDMQKAVIGDDIPSAPSASSLDTEFP